MIKAIILFLLMVSMLTGCMTVKKPENKTEDDPAAPATPAVTEPEEESSVIKNPITEGKLYDTVVGIIPDAELVEVQNPDVGSKDLSITITTNEENPLKNARKYLEYVKQIRTDCNDIFKENDYISVNCHMKVKDFTGNLFFYTVLKKDGDMYAIKDFVPADIMSLSDENYIEALNIALDELN